MEAIKGYAPKSYTKYTFKTVPYDHQRKVLRECWQRPYYAWFWQMGCVDCSTEYHNGERWVPISEYKEGDKVLVWDEKRNAHWEKPEAYIKLPCDTMYHFKHVRGLDQMLSKEHRMYFYNGSGKEKVRTAEEVAQWASTRTRSLGKDCKLPILFHLESGNKEYPLPLLRLLVAVSADGHFTCNTNYCVIRVKKQRKKDRLLSLLKECSIEFKMREESTGFTVFAFYAPEKIKVFPAEWLSTLGTEALRAIADESLLWDGNCEDSYYTTVKENADFIQFAFAATGRRASVLVDNREGRPLCYIVHVAKETGTCGRGYYSIQKDNISIVPTVDGYKYCFTVSTGRLVLRRNGRIFLTGNSGKTKEAIDNFSALFLHNLINGVLIIAPKGVYRNWTEKEIPEHMPDYLSRRMCFWSKRKAAQTAIRNMCEGPCPEFKLDILVVNIDTVINKEAEALFARFLETHQAMMIIDESTRIKNISAKRTRACIRLGRLAKYRRILTGTPLLNSPLDIYAQCDFLNPAVCKPGAGVYVDNPLGFNNYHSFRARYAIMQKMRIGSSIREIPVSYTRLDELNHKLESFSSRVTKEECLDLPDKIYQIRTVPYTDEQIKYYNDMAKKSRIFLEGFQEEMSPIYAKIALTQMLRLHQISTGFVSTEDGQVFPISNNRLSELLDVLGEVDFSKGKVIIWSNFVPAIEDMVNSIKEHFGSQSVVSYYGKTPEEDRLSAVKEFQNPDSQVKIFVGNPATAGMGLTLTQATTVIYYSNSFSLEHRLQSEDRAHRVGQKHPVTYIDFVSTKLDGDILKALRDKKDIADMVVDGELSGWLEVRKGD